MKPPDDALRLRHMLEHATEAVELARGKDREDLDRDRLLELSLTRLVEIVGEAASQVSREARDRYTSIPWPDVVGMRNRLIHGYDIVDDLPPLIAALDGIVGVDPRSTDQATEQ